MVLVVSNRILVAREHEAEFEARWKNRKWAVAQSPGFIRTGVLRPVKGDHYVALTHWDSIEDFEKWTESAFREPHRDTPRKETFSGPS